MVCAPCAPGYQTPVSAPSPSTVAALAAPGASQNASAGLLARVGRLGRAVVRLLWGALLLGAPRAVLRVAPGRDPDDQRERRVRVVVRVLGARHLLQGAAELALGPDAVAAGRVGAAVDAAHSLSMVALAGFDRRRRVVASTDAAVAAAFAASGALLWQRRASRRR